MEILNVADQTAMEKTAEKKERKDKMTSFLPLATLMPP